MTLKSRAVLIVCGIIIFLTVAPIVIFLARGFRYDFAKHRLIKTGGLMIKTEPKNALVFLNQKKQKSTTPLTRRFLAPGDYSLEIKKEGFQPWQKTIPIYEELVTYLPSSGPEKIFLFLKNPRSFIISTTTQDFLAPSDEIYYLQKGVVYRAAPMGEKKTLVATTTADILNPELITANHESEQNQYYISPDKKNFLMKNPNANDTRLLAESLPRFTESQIIVAPTKRIFLLLDDTLYQVMETLEKINSPVSYATWDADLEGLVYGNSHEVWLYLPERQENELVTRSSQILGPAVYNKKTGYVFVAESNQIKAIELDPLGQPQVYVLVETKNSKPKLAVNREGTDLIYLDGQTLYSLKIR